MSQRIDWEGAEATLLGLLRIPGPSGREGEVARAVREIIGGLGDPALELVEDDASTRLPYDASTGNLIVRIPGDPSLAEVLFVAHLDTVPGCDSAEPFLETDAEGTRWIRQKGGECLGGDDRAGVAVLIALARTLVEGGVPHPPLTLLFTVGEERGASGARHVALDLLGKPLHACSIDGNRPDVMVLAAPSKDTFRIELLGKASHAGIAPEKGISAALVASDAIHTLASSGWHGRVERDGSTGTCNIGVISGGDATNKVMARIEVIGEARSHDEAFLGAMVDRVRRSFEDAAAKATNRFDGRAQMKSFRVERMYDAFSLPEDHPVVVRTARAIRSCGLEPRFRRHNGGLDASWLNAHGIPTVTIGAGVQDAHSSDERIHLGHFRKACEVALELATMP